MKVCKNEDCAQEYSPIESECLDTHISLDGGFCPECRKKRLAEYEKKEQESQDQQLRQQRNKWIQSSGIPYRFIHSTFDTFVIRASLENVVKVSRNYAETFPIEESGRDYHSLVLFSDHRWGVGKSHLAIAIALRLIERCTFERTYSPVLFTTEPDMFRRIRSTYNRQDGNETEMEVYQKLSLVPLLIIDDVGKEEVADARFIQRIWFGIIDGRYQRKLPILITANLTPDALMMHLGGNRENEACFDRLVEMTGKQFWELKVTSYRQEGNK